MMSSTGGGNGIGKGPSATTIGFLVLGKIPGLAVVAIMVGGISGLLIAFMHRLGSKALQIGLSQPPLIKIRLI